MEEFALTYAAKLFNFLSELKQGNLSFPKQFHLNIQLFWSGLEHLELEEASIQVTIFISWMITNRHEKMEEVRAQNN